MFDDTPFSASERDATVLARAAVALYSARESRDGAMLDAALDMNLLVWDGIRSQTSQPESAVPADVRDDLAQLSALIAFQCGAHRERLDDADIDAMIDTNLQIAEGLLQGSFGARTA
jgi:flagellar biosynthesis regulator FlaF